MIIGVNGVFGERMCEVARRCGAEVVRVEQPWGRAIDPQQLLDAQPSAPARAPARGRARRDVDRRRERDRAARRAAAHRHAAARRHRHVARRHPGRGRRVGDRRRVLGHAEVPRRSARASSPVSFSTRAVERVTRPRRRRRSRGTSTSASSPTTSAARAATTTPRRSRCSTRCTRASVCCSTRGSRRRTRGTAQVGGLLQDALPELGFRAVRRGAPAPAAHVGVAPRGRRRRQGARRAARPVRHRGRRRPRRRSRARAGASASWATRAREHSVVALLGALRERSSERRGAPVRSSRGVGWDEQLLAVEAELLDRLADVVEGAVVLGLARPLR